MNKRILGLALPNIITNITVPLLGMVDMAIVGRLSADHIGAIAIGTQIFNLIYWNFGFLRMGTSGFTAQAYGAHDFNEAVRIFVRAICIALAVALALILLQWPISLLSAQIFKTSRHVLQLALAYFFVRIWAAPATLGLYAIKGWFIGMQNSRLPMWIAIFLNCVNIVCSLVFVLVLHWDIRGVALGTVIAQYSGLAVGLFFLIRNYGHLFAQYTSAFHSRVAILKDSLKWSEMRRFFKVNIDIFLRTVCLATVFTFITAASGRISPQILAVDALLMQFFTLFSYIMDGFAYAGEALGGRYWGAGDMPAFRSTVRRLFGWGAIMTVIFTLVYVMGGMPFLRLLTDEPGVVEASHDYVWWAYLIPICGVAAFIWDGIFIGTTQTRGMLLSAALAAIVFFALALGLLSVMGNHGLWLAMVFYLFMRGGVQTVWFARMKT